jgi:hypothetical protein
MRHVSVVVDDWQQLDWHWSYSRASDGSGGELHLVLRLRRDLLTLMVPSGRGYGDLFVQCIPQRYSWSQTPSGLWNACSLDIRTLGIILRRDAQCLPVVCLLWYSDVFRRASLRNNPELTQSQLLAYAQHAAREVSHAYNQPVHELN